MQGKRIVFLGTHGQHNIGDELLLETFLIKLGRANRYFVNSYDPAFTEGQLRPRFDATVFHTANDRIPFLRHLLGCDLLFFGGGSIIKELYASVGRNPYSTLLMVLATVSFTNLIARKPVVMSNIGVGPLRTPRGRRLAGMILRQVDLLSVRDRKSHQTCRDLGLPSDRVVLVPDAVFANPPEAFGGLPERPLPQGKGVRLALNLNYDIENPANWETFQQNLADTLKLLHRQTPLEIHGLSMQGKFKAQTDSKVLAEFRNRIPEIPVVLHDPVNHLEAAGVIRSCDLLVSERLHALVMAAILGVPSFALMYDVKVRELAGTLGLDDNSVDINRPFDPEDVARRIQLLREDSGAASARLLDRSAGLRRELDGYFAGLDRRFA